MYLFLLNIKLSVLISLSLSFNSLTYVLLPANGGGSVVSQSLVPKWSPVRTLLKVDLVRVSNLNKLNRQKGKNAEKLLHFD